MSEFDASISSAGKKKNDVIYLNRFCAREGFSKHWQRKLHFSLLEAVLKSHQC